MASRLPPHSSGSAPTSPSASARREGQPQWIAIGAIALAVLSWSALPAPAREVLGVGVRVSPAVNRAVIAFKDVNGVTRGATSVAIRTR